MRNGKRNEKSCGEIWSERYEFGEESDNESSHLGEDNNEAPTRSNRQRTAKSFGNDFIVYLVDDTPTTISEALAPLDADYDVYARVCSCRQCWASKCRGL
jgi:hypothetical protein